MSPPLIWTKEKPSQPGWYWYRAKDTDMPHPVKVYAIGLSLYVWPLADEALVPTPQLLDQSVGEFASLELPYIPAYVTSGTYY